MCRTRFLSIFLAMFIASSAVHAATTDVYVFNNEFSTNLPGEPLNKHAVITVGDTIRWVRIQGNHTTTSVIGSPEQWDAPINNQNLSSHTPS
jgi:plastocyanin